MLSIWPAAAAATLFNDLYDCVDHSHTAKCDAFQRSLASIMSSAFPTSALQRSTVLAPLLHMMRAAVFLAALLASANGMRLPLTTGRKSATSMAQPVMIALDAPLSGDALQAGAPVPVVFGKILRPSRLVLKAAAKKKEVAPNSHLDFLLKAPLVGAAVGASSAFVTGSIVDVLYKIAS